jgi:hypothetical protein
MVRPTWDGKITLSSILTIIGMVGGIIVFWASFTNRMTASEVKLREIETRNERLEERVEKRLERIEDKIDRMSGGR